MLVLSTLSTTAASEDHSTNLIRLPNQSSWSLWLTRSRVWSSGKGRVIQSELSQSMDHQFQSLIQRMGTSHWAISQWREGTCPMESLLITNLQGWVTYSPISITGLDPHKWLRKWRLLFYLRGRNLWIQLSTMNQLITAPNWAKFCRRFRKITKRAKSANRQLLQSKVNRIVAKDHPIQLMYCCLIWKITGKRGIMALSNGLPQKKGRVCIIDYFVH